LKPDPTALIIDGDRASRRLLRVVLEPQGYRIVEADSGAAALSKAVAHKPDVIILELVLPDGDGLSVLHDLQEWNQAPVLVLSEKVDDEAKVGAFDAGARDYMTKPFSSVELVARLRVLQRPLPNVPDGPLLVQGDLVVNLGTHEISLNGHTVRLTRKEEALFYVLARYAGTVVTCGHLIHSAWGADAGERIHELRVFIANLRKKLGKYGGGMLIRTEGSLGYCLCVSPNREPSLSAVVS
jgi:two-component system KDP operon response regulator KdpE